MTSGIGARHRNEKDRQETFEHHTQALNINTEASIKNPGAPRPS